MSEHTYTPSIKIWKVVQRQAAIVDIKLHHLTDYPTPKNLKLLVDLWRNTNFLSDYHKSVTGLSFGDALCGSRRHGL